MRPKVDDEYLIPPKRRWSRLLSAGIAVAYVVGASLNADIKTTIEVCMFCVLPLGCIWFPQALGDYIGFVGSGRFITAASPAGGIAFMGWVLLLLPAVVRGIAWLMGVNLDVF